jgi:glucose-6-phosphate dehydrogenase assembly protein OpcA
VTQDVIALTRETPDVRAIVAGLRAAGDEWRVRQDADGAVVQLCDDDGRVLVSIEAPVLVQVPGEVARLLGVDVPVPVWWVETRSPSGVEIGTVLARRFADEVVRRLGGVVWP